MKNTTETTNSSSDPNRNNISTEFTLVNPVFFQVYVSAVWAAIPLYAAGKDK